MSSNEGGPSDMKTMLAECGMGFQDLLASTSAGSDRLVDEFKAFLRDVVPTIFRETMREETPGILKHLVELGYIEEEEPDTELEAEKKAFKENLKEMVNNLVDMKVEADDFRNFANDQVDVKNLEALMAMETVHKFIKEKKDKPKVETVVLECKPAFKPNDEKKSQEELMKEFCEIMKVNSDHTTKSQEAWNIRQEAFALAKKSSQTYSGLNAKLSNDEELLPMEALFMKWAHGKTDVKKFTEPPKGSEVVRKILLEPPKVMPKPIDDKLLTLFKANERFNNSMVHLRSVFNNYKPGNLDAEKNRLREELYQLIDKALPDLDDEQ